MLAEPDIGQRLTDPLGPLPAGSDNGFTVSPNRLQEDLELFVDQVVPLLQDMPYYASSYEERCARRAGLPEVQRVEGRLCPF